MKDKCNDSSRFHGVWEKTALGEILIESKEKSAPGSNPEKKYVGLEHIKKDHGVLQGYGSSTGIRSSKNVFSKGDLLYGKLRPYLNKVAIPDFDGVCSTDILVFKKQSHLSHGFIKYRLLCRDFVNYAQLNISGVHHPRIHKKFIDKFSVFLPPLPEQFEIVRKIEELFSELGNGIESLKKAREQLKTYRQAVLKHAFEGKLTQEWRARQAAAGSPPESAEKLLERIREEREEHYKKQVEDWKKACEQAKAEGRKKPVKPKKPKNLPPVTKEELSELPELPEGWQWVRLGNVIKEIFDGPYGTNLKTKDYVEDGVRVIRLENIGVLDFIEAKRSYISEEKYNLLKQHKVSYGDIIFSSFISDQIRVAILPNYIKRAINKADCFCIRVSDFYLFKKYMAFYLSTQSCYSQLVHQVHGATRPRVNTTQLKNCCIPLCSHQEQSEISYELESRLSVCDQLEQSIEDSLGKAESLRQSILKKAFSGELTQQWREENPELISGENSAELLLERIQTEKKKVGAKEKNRAGKKKTT